MKVSKTSMEGILLIEPDLFGDSRGFFMESYSRKKYTEHGIDMEFVQDNHSKSVKNTLRGLHYQIKPGQDKIVRVVSGEVFDVVVDMRYGSPTFGKWEGFVLSAANKRQLFVPIGFAHGFCVLSEEAEFLYKCSDYYSPVDERGIIWNDPDLNVKWPIENPILSERDKKNKFLKDMDKDFIYK